MQRFNLGPKPTVKVRSCGGSLNIWGAEREDVKIEGILPEQDSIQVNGDNLEILSLSGSASIHLPQDGCLEIEHIGGNLDVKNIKGSARINEVGGNCTVRAVEETQVTGDIGGNLQIRGIGTPTVIEGDIHGTFIARTVAPLTVQGSIFGGAQVRDVEGSVELNQVHGDCFVRGANTAHIDTIHGETTIRDIKGDVTLKSSDGDAILRDIEGMVTIERIGGDLLGRNLQQGMTVEAVLGDVALRTAFAEGSTSSFQSVGGDVIIRIPGKINTHFILPSDAEYDLSDDLTTAVEGDKLIVQSGDGLATVHVKADGRINIKSRSSESLDDEFTIAFDQEVEEQWANISARIAERLEEKNRMISDRVRRKIEASLHSAQRHIEMAQHRAETALKKLEETPPQGDIIGEGLLRRDEVTEEERLMILQMLENGKITVEEAENLLAAMEK